MPTTTLRFAQNWARLKIAVSGAHSVVMENPNYLASIKPSLEHALQLLAGKPSPEAIDEIEYFIGRVDQYVAQWRPKPRQYPGTFYVPPSWAANTDREAQEALRLISELRQYVIDAPVISRKEDVMKVFVSHSSADKPIATAFVELLRAALPLSAKEIRCTSVDGYKLSVGTHSDDQLRQEVFDVETFVALLSPTSIKSIYVLFELGARWGAKGYLAPVMVAGLDPSFLKPPLSAIHAVSATSEGDIHQLLQTLAERLSVECEKPQVYVKALRAFLDAASVP